MPINLKQIHILNMSYRLPIHNSLKSLVWYLHKDN